MPRLRGLRRACFVLASALPLVADVPEPSGVGRHGPPEVEDAATTVMESDPAEALSTKTTAIPESITRQPIVAAHDTDDGKRRTPLTEDWAQAVDFDAPYEYHPVVVPFRPTRRRDPVVNRTQTNPESDQQPSITPNAHSVSSLPAAAEVAESEEEEKHEEQSSAAAAELEKTSDDSDAMETTPDISATSNDEDTSIIDSSPLPALEELPPSEPEEETSSSSSTDGVGEDTGPSEDEASPVTTNVMDSLENDKSDGEEAVKSVKFDFASKSAGALILEKSAGWKGASDLLNGDKDRYAMIPCAEASKSVVVSLSEDVYVKTILLANYERFSSTVKDFQLLGSQTMGTWVDLGTYTAKPGGGKQQFELNEYSWARYLKLKVLSHHGDEHYLTISQLSVFGDTMLQGFHEQWEEEQEQVQEESSVQSDLPQEMTDGTIESDTVETEDGAEVLYHNVYTEAGDAIPATTIDIAGFTTNVACQPHSGSTCPKDLSFEHMMFLYASNQSHADDMSFLSTSTSCRSFQKYKHEGFPEISVQSMSPVASIASVNGEAIKEKARSLSTESVRINLDMESAPVVAQIKNLIRSTGGIDVDLSKVSLFRGKDSTLEPAPKGLSDSRNTDDDPSVQSIPSLPETSETVTSTSQQFSQDEPREVRDNLFNAHELEVLLKSLEGVPSSSCLVEIDFQEYRKRVASNNAGPGNGQSAGGGPELQPIFKKLTDEIKTLQSTLGIQEDFIKSTISCYQKVLLELILQHQDMRAKSDKRLDNLEHAINTYLLWLQFVEECITSFREFMRSIAAFCQPLWSFAMSSGISEILLVLCIAVPALLVCRVLLFNGWRYLRRGFSARGHGEKRANRDTVTAQSESSTSELEAKETPMRAGKTEYSSTATDRLQNETSQVKKNVAPPLLLDGTK